MGRYEDLEHDSTEDPEAQGPEGLAAPTAVGEPPEPKGFVAKLRQKMKEKRNNKPWLSIDNDEIWEGDAYPDDDE